MILPSRNDATSTAATKDVKAQKYKEAIVEFRNAVKVDPKFGEARYQLGEAYVQTGALPDAYREYVRAADLLPANVDAQVKAGSMLLLAGKFEDAKARADKALAINASSVDGEILRANALAGLKDIDAAVKEIESAIALDPSGARPTRASARCSSSKATKRPQQPRSTGPWRSPPVGARAAGAGKLLLVDRPAGRSRGVAKAAVAIDANDVAANRALATFYVASQRAARPSPF